MTSDAQPKALLGPLKKLSRFVAFRTRPADDRGFSAQTAAAIAHRMRNITSPEPKKTVILCTDERTGSHYLAELLASTGILGRAYEYFNTSWMKEHYEDYPEDVIDQLSWAKRLGTTSNGVFSLKLHPWTMDRISPHIDLRCDLPQPRFVVLHRNDLLGQAISLHKAQWTRSYTSWSKAVSKPAYDGERIKALLSELAMRRQRWEVYFSRNGIVPFRVEYEQLLNMPSNVVAGIAQAAEIGETPVLGRELWYRFDRQSDTVNAEWRARFLAEFVNTRSLDVLPAQPSC
jgi:LPS sulfotransferase NodH